MAVSMDTITKNKLMQERVSERQGGGMTSGRRRSDVIAGDVNGE
jgi:hypothetical protein